MHMADRVTLLEVLGPTGAVCWCDAPIYGVLVVIESPDGRPIEVGTIHRCTNSHLEV